MKKDKAKPVAQSVPSIQKLMKELENEQKSRADEKIDQSIANELGSDADVYEFSANNRGGKITERTNESESELNKFVSDLNCNISVDEVTQSVPTEVAYNSRKSVDRKSLGRKSTSSAGRHTGP